MNPMIEKIQKLLSKAKDSATTQAESAAFLAKAQELMLRHRLDFAELETGKDETINTESTPLNEEDRGKSKIATWKAVIVNALVPHNGTFVHFSGSSIMITGTPENVAIVRCLYAHCIREVDRLVKRSAYGKGARYCNAFRLGAAAAIRDAVNAEVKRQREEYASNERAMVIINQAPIQAQKCEALARARLNLVAARRRSVSTRSDGFNDGYSKGGSIYGGYGKNRIGYQ
jgi:hypothetical protein